MSLLKLSVVFEPPPHTHYAQHGHVDLRTAEAVCGRRVRLTDLDYQQPTCPECQSWLKATEEES